MFIFNILCSNGTLEVIDERTNILGKCFLDTCLLVPFYSIFATVNVYILASENNLSRKVNDFNINSMRILTFLLFFVSLIEIFMKYFWVSKLVDSESVMLVSDLYLFISLGIHFFVVLNKNIFCFFPIKLMISLTFFLVVNLVKFINLFYQRKLRLETNDIFFMEGIFNGLLVLYFIFVILNYKKPNLPFQILEASTENLIQEEDVNNDIYSEEDSANYFSYLTVSWLKPLMEK